MYRIDDATAATSLPVPEAASAEGFFTEGNAAAGTPATNVRGSWLNMIQEELRNVVLAGGLTPSKTTHTQIRDAIRAYVGPGRLYRTLVYINVGTTTNAQCSIDGGAFAALSTYTPSPNLVRQRLRGCGGGGGGGGTPATASGQAAASPGGGAGSFFEKTLIGANLIATAVAVSPGIGGLGASGAAGFNGTATTVGSIISAPGGGGGNVPAALAGTQIVGGTSGGAPGTGGDINSGGQPGGGAQSIAGARAIAGNGGSSPFGSGGTGQQDNTAGTQASGFGAGGSGRAVGSSVAATAGNPATNGIVIIEEYI